jgi:hypothetical protein
MKLFLLSSLLFFASPMFAREVSYTASTPAGKQIRNFLGISPSDSIDFIRWLLKIKDAKEFIISCNYGLSKPNTNGFVHENKVAFSGTITPKDDVLILNYEGNTQGLQILNDNILHLLNNDGTLMAGNGGWSYTLNAMTQVSTKEINLKHQAVSFKDSILFEGRTPCKGIEEMMLGKTRPECYKKKWLVYLYKNAPTSGTYRIGSTAGSYKGKWKLKEDAAGKTVYTLELNNGRTLNLLHVDNNIVYLMNPNGELMVGDHDFSYSLNRRIR